MGRNHWLHRLFAIGVFIKGVDAVIECAAGIALFIVSTGAIVALVHQAVQEQVIGNPDDLLGHHLLMMAQHFSVATKSFYAAYLLGHGLIKVVLVAGLLTGRRWSYPVALIALAGFIAYQLYRVSLTGSVGLILLTVFDLGVLLLIWHEWRTVCHA